MPRGILIFTLKQMQFLCFIRLIAVNVFKVICMTEIKWHFIFFSSWYSVKANSKCTNYGKEKVVSGTWQKNWMGRGVHKKVFEIGPFWKFGKHCKIYNLSQLEYELEEVSLVEFVNCYKVFLKILSGGPSRPHIKKAVQVRI